MLLLKVRSEMHSKVREAEDQGVLEKKKERERAKVEVADDLKFNSMMGIVANRHTFKLLKLIFCRKKYLSDTFFISTTSQE